jgi:hypothetical protein
MNIDNKDVRGLNQFLILLSNMAEKCPTELKNEMMIGISKIKMMERMI